MMTSDEIRARVTSVLVMALGVEEEEVTPSATILGDLGAESIDFLDIVFRLEREFRIKIPHGELFVESLVLGGQDYVHDGRVSDAGLAAIRSRLPYADLSELERGGWLIHITDLFTVDLLVRYVAWKLEAADEDPATALVAPGSSRR